MKIVKSTLDDMEMIFQFYEMAIAHQKKVFHKNWEGFEKDRVEKELKVGLHYKIIERDVVVCIFVISLNDPEIWGEKDKTPSIYLHRIVTHPDFRGRFYVKTIRDWAIDYAKEHDLDCVRLDTWGDNPKLQQYYQYCGFTFLGIFTPSAVDTLPAHYSKNDLSFFEIEV